MKKPYEICVINGLKVGLYPIKGFPAVKANLFIHGGSSYESGKQWGAFHFVEHLCFEGTKLFPNRANIELYKEEYGLNNNGSTSLGSVRFWTYGPKQSFEQALTFLNEVAFNATLPEDSYTKQVNIISQEIKGYWDNPNFRFGDAIRKQLYGSGHIYAKDAGGQAEYLSTLSRKDLLNIYDDFFKNENCVLTVTGDFKIDEVKEIIKGIYLAEGGTRHSEPQEKMRPGERLVTHIEDVQQDKINIIWTGKGFKKTDYKDELCLQIGSYILGGSSRSLLFKRLRESLHLVYSTGMSTSLLPYSGSLDAWAATTPDNTEKAIDEMRKVIFEFLEKPIETELFQRSVNFIKSNRSLAFDSISSISDSITSDLFWDGEIRLPEEIIKDLESITEAQVRKIMAEYIQTKNEFVSIMSRKKFEPSVD